MNKVTVCIFMGSCRSRAKYTTLSIEYETTPPLIVAITEDVQYLGCIDHGDTVGLRRVDSTLTCLSTQTKRCRTFEFKIKRRKSHYVWVDNTVMVSTQPRRIRVIRNYRNDLLLSPQLQNATRYILTSSESCC